MKVIPSARKYGIADCDIIYVAQWSLFVEPFHPCCSSTTARYLARVRAT